MSTEPDPFLALDVSGDNYGTVAAQDQQAGADATPAAAVAEQELDSDAEKERARAARTLQTEEDYLKQKESYTARIDRGDLWKHLMNFSPPFRPSSSFLSSVNNTNIPIDPPSSPMSAPVEKTKLDKKQHQAIQAAVAELYFAEKYEPAKEIVTWAKEGFEKDKKFVEQVGKWENRVQKRIEAQGK